MTKEKLAKFEEAFKKEILPELKKTLGIKNNLAVPRVKMIKINVGIGSYIQSHNKDFSNIVDNIALISGQKPVVNLAKKAISNFKIKQKDPIGISVTIRGKRMYDFLNKLINVVFPRVRDFRGLPRNAFDNNGNYNVGLKEHIVFPEVPAEDISKIHGLQITIVTTAKNNEHGYELLKALGFPFRKK